MELEHQFSGSKETTTIATLRHGEVTRNIFRELKSLSSSRLHYFFSGYQLTIQVNDDNDTHGEEDPDIATLFFEKGGDP